MNIVQAIKDENLIQPFLGDDLSSWRPWVSALRVMYGLPLSRSDRIRARKCTGRDPAGMPAEGFDTALFLTGRRSGKSRIASVIGAYEAILAGHEDRLSKGEQGVVAVCAPTKHQAQIVKSYLRAVFDCGFLRHEVSSDTSDGFSLNNGNRITILAGDWRTIRGFTLIAAIIDEACFFGYDAESKVRSDTELVRAIKPALATVGGKLICISSPYAKQGYCFQQTKKQHGNDKGKNLVWWAPSQTMNPTLPQKAIDDALAEDYAAARSEYFAEFRDDVAAYISREVVERLVVSGRTRLLPRPDTRYFAFADMSGGRGDASVLAIAHREDGKIVLDSIVEFKPPFNPIDVIETFCDELRRYRCGRVMGDNYAAEFVCRTFNGFGVRYIKCEKPKSVLYAELLPHLCADGLSLLDHPPILDQIAGLERRTRSGGRDIIDHRPGAHDDVANAVAGVVVAATKRGRKFGAICN